MLRKITVSKTSHLSHGLRATTGAACHPCPTYKLPAIFESVETDALGHAGHAEESFREMHLAEAVPATASNDSNITPVDARSRVMFAVMFVVAPLLQSPAGRLGRSFVESVSLIVCLFKASPAVQLLLIAAVRWQGSDPGRFLSYWPGSIKYEVA